MFKEIGWEGVDGIHLAKDRNQRRRFVNHDNALSGSIKFW
jgi:hypothetical protein